MSGSVKNRTVTGVIYDVINYIILSSLLVITLYPFWFIFIYSISNPNSVVGEIPRVLPHGFSLENYILLFNRSNIGYAAFISLARTVIGTGLTTFSCAMFAYVLTKELMPFRKSVYRLMILTMYVSPGIIPIYILIKQIHLTDNFLVYVLPTTISGFYVIIIKTFMESLPSSLEESAFVDGASHMTVFLRIIVPLCLPVLATVAIFSSVNQWNMWYDNMIFCPSKRLETLQLLLYNYLANQEANIAAIQQSMNAGESLAKKVTPASVRMAITIIVTFPIMLVYPFFQRFFIKGILIGAVKG